MFLSPGAIAQTAAQKKTIDSILTELNQKGMFNGVVLLAENGKAIYQRAIGVAGPSSSKSLSLNSSFNLASISKQFKAMMTMMTMILKEKGAL